MLGLRRGSHGGGPFPAAQGQGCGATPSLEMHWLLAQLAEVGRSDLCFPPKNTEQVTDMRK